MKRYGFVIFVFLLWATFTRCEKGGNYLDADSVRMLNNLITEILESLRPNLARLFVKNQPFVTGPQEFGNFCGNFSEMTIDGLEKFNVKLINTTMLDINNLTIEEKEFSVNGIYHVNGTLAFPLGKSDIRLFGDGKFRAKFTNFSFSMKMKIRFDNGNKILKDFDIVVGLQKIEVYFHNLMGGGDLERVFNQLINDVGLIVFNYYKDPVMKITKPFIAKIITDLLNQKIDSNLPKTEL